LQSGPGLGRSDGTIELVRILLERLDKPIVLDADGLWELEPFARGAPTVLTPHVGETGAAAEDRVDGGRRAPVGRGSPRSVAVRLGRLLKGADTLVAAPREGCSSPGTAPRHSRRPALAMS